METKQDKTAMNQYLLALTDVERIQIISQLIQSPCSLDQLSVVTGIPLSAIERHLSYLIDLGLVENRQDQDPGVYIYKEKTMDTMNRMQSAAQKQPDQTPWAEMPEENRRRISNLLAPDGRLQYIPTQSKKALPILEHVAASFEKDREYSEKEVNALLEKYSKDTSTLRRFLIEFGFLGRTRDGARYWRK